MTRPSASCLCCCCYSLPCFIAALCVYGDLGILQKMVSQKKKKKEKIGGGLGALGREKDFKEGYL
jgi:hypothetical protein